MRGIDRRGAIFVLLAVLVMLSSPVLAATNTVIASENTDDTDFSNAPKTEDFTVKGTGESAKITYSGVGEYLAGAYHWSLDDNEKPAVDEVKGYDMKFTNSPTYVTGMVGSGALQFQDADNDYISNTEPFDPNNNAAYSLHARVKATGSVSDEDAIFQWDGGVIIRYQSGEMRYYHKDASGSWNLIASPAVNADTVYDVGMSWDGSEVEAYLNGSQVGRASISGMTLAANTNKVGLGHPDAAGGTNDFGFTGTIDEPRIWKESLSDSQFQTLHNNPDALLKSASTDGYATYLSQNHTVSEAVKGKVNITTLDQATAYVEWQYLDAGSWKTHTNTSYTTTGVKAADLSTVTTDKWRVRVHVADGDTNGKVSVQGDWVTFTNNSPNVDNSTASPTGTLNSQSPTFKINVSDPDFATAQGDTVNASLYVNGAYKGSDTLTSNGTAKVEAKVTGESQYYWNLTDSYGGTQESDTFNITTPSVLYVFNATTPHNLVDNVQVNVTVTGSGGTTELTQVGDGKVSLAGLPTGESYVFTINAEGYYPREVYIEDLFNQQAVYLLDKDTASVRNTITVNDRTGQFGEGTVIIVDRVINTSTIEQTDDNGAEWVTMGGDRLGTSGFYVIRLKQYGRYRFRVLNDQGDMRVLGEYTAKSGGQVNLQIGTIKYSLGKGENTYEWDVSQTNITNGGHSVTFAYNDHENLTENVSVAIKTRENGTVIGSQDFTAGPYGEVVYTETINSSFFANHTFVVDWSAERNGTVLTGKRLVGGKATMDPPISDLWKAVAYGAFVLILAFFIGAGIGPAPALVTVGLSAGMAVYVGLAPAGLGFGSAVLVIAIGGIYIVRNTRQPV